MSSLPVFDAKTGALRYVLEFSNSLLGKGTVVPYFGVKGYGEIVFPFTRFSPSGMDGSIQVCLADEEILGWLDERYLSVNWIHRVGDAHGLEAQQLGVVLASATEWQLATLERLLMLKSSKKSEIRRQQEIADTMVRHCWELRVPPYGLRGQHCERMEQAMSELGELPEAQP